MAVEEKVTFCRLCEQLCGLRITVEDGATVTRIRADKEHPVTHGFACPKGLAANEIQADPDRVTRPLRRTSDGSFEPVSWDAAITEIGDRLRNVIAEHGSDGVGIYMGNPAAFNAPHFLWAKGMLDAIGSPHFYSSGSQDTNSRLVASHFLYGSPFTVPIPDLPRTDFLVMVGANPFVSHGSLLAGGIVRVDVQAIVDRGGRVVVIDPRRTETAERFEHEAVRPDGDAWLLLSLLQVMFAEGLTDEAAPRVSTGMSALRRVAEPFSPEVAQQHSGVPAEVARKLARDLAAAPSAAVYGRVGACLGSHGTLVNFLLDALNVVTGNLDRPGGSVFATPAIDFMGVAKKQGLDTYAAYHTRVGHYPEIGGMMPAGVMAEEITTPGPGQVRALFVTAGNPVLSVPGQISMESALRTLDLMVCIDVYVTETTGLADFILPATTFLEREDVNSFVQPYQYKGFVQWTDAVVTPRGEAREEWTIFRDICAQIGVVASSSPLVRRLGPLGRILRPRMMLDAMLRMGPVGDRFGLRRGGLRRKSLLNRPHGVMVSEEVPTGVLKRFITRPDGVVDLAPGPIISDAQRLLDEAGTEFDAAFPMRLFGRRELRSLNSWMHNSPRLNPKMRPGSLLMHPDDARKLSLRDGAEVLVESASGSVTAQLSTTDSVMPGAVCLPHGWGHNGIGGWQRANASGGTNVNLLTASGAGALEPLAAMSILNGVRVRVLSCEPVSLTDVRAARDPGRQREDA